MELTPQGWLAETRLVVCVGAGGVGKTTAAASIALQGALAGRRTMVLTIDPARRLANSLGLVELGNEERRIDLSGLPATDGELWAMMLDSRSTFDAVVTRVSSDEQARQRIFDNHVYRHMSDTFAGSQDYMATEKLHDIVVSGRFELVVLDTPPVQNALDFLESPGRLVNFLDERILRWFLQPYERQRGLGRGLVLGTSAVLFRLLAYVFGRDFLDDLAEFFRDFRGLYAGFRERHRTVQRIFRDPGTSFVVVTAPTPSAAEVARFFERELTRRGLPRGGILINQVHTCDVDAHDAGAVLGDLALAAAAGLPARVPASVIARLGMAHRRLHAQARADEAVVEALLADRQPGGFRRRVPRLEGNVHDLAGLKRVAEALFGPPENQVRNGGIS